MDPSSEIAHYYTLLDKRVHVVEIKAETLGVEVSRLRNAQGSVKDANERLTSALLGNSTLGLDGMLQRTEALEQKIECLENTINKLIRFIVVSHSLVFLSVAAIAWAVWFFYVP